MHGGSHFDGRFAGIGLYGESSNLFPGLALSSLERIQRIPLLLQQRMSRDGGRSHGDAW